VRADVDRQAVYTRVRDHLLKQKRKSKDGGLGCLYRGPDGTKCAVGCLIPDELYDPGIEHAACDEMRVIRVLRKIPGMEDVTGEDAKFLRGLQSIHDRDDPDEWEESLGDFARENGLEV
jgi:hypothetical protein